MPGIIDQLRQSSSTQCCPPHEVLSSQWWVNLIERYLTMSHCSSHIFTSSGLLELIEGSFPSITGTKNTSERSLDGYGESCIQETYNRLELFTRDFSDPDWLFERAVRASRVRYTVMGHTTRSSMSCTTFIQAQVPNTARTMKF